jgi:hypothetical protein
MNLKDTDLKYLYRKWKNNLGPFEAFMRSGPFVSLQTYENFEIDFDINDEELSCKYKNVIYEILQENLRDTFVIIDLNLNESLELAYILNNKHSLKPILNYNFLFHPYGLIGNEDEIGSLVKLGYNLKEINPEGYILFLDYGRYKDLPQELYKKKLNNQYELTEEDLPNIETLKELGYSKVVLFTRETIKEDINCYLDYMKSELKVKVISHSGESN